MSIGEQGKMLVISESEYIPIYNDKSEDLSFLREHIERDKWAFERLILDPRYESWLRRRAIRRSLHHTTRIEGNTLREDQVGEILDGQKTQADEKQVAEIENCYKAYQFADSISDDVEVSIDEHVICHINALILGNDDPLLTPGQYRRGENWVRHYRTGRRVYTPPNQGDVPSLMRGFSLWLRKEHKEHPVVTAGIAHLRLVEIHPFWDGNGRTARVLATLILQRLGYGFNKLLSLERNFSFDLANYFEAINSVVGDHFEEQRDITPWLEYFVKELSFEIASVSDDLLDFRRFMELWQKTYIGQYNINARQVDALAYAYLHDSIRPRDYMQHTKVSHETARRELGELVEMGLLRCVGHGRARRYLSISAEERETQPPPPK